MLFCDKCNKSFCSNSTLKRHVRAFHTDKRTGYQCWNCHKIYVRKENVLLHSRKDHGDAEGKFIILETTNTKYKPEIFVPDPWIPPIEARTKTKGTIYKIRILTKQVTTPTAISLPEQQQWSRTEPAPSVKQQQTELVPQSQEKIWTPLTTRTIDKHFNTSVTLELLKDDLLLSDSDTSISSTDTICLDQPNEQNTNFLPALVYNAFKLLNYLWTIYNW